MSEHQSPALAVLDACERMLEKICPELFRSPVYLTGLPDDYPQSQSRHIMAFTTCGAMDFVIRDHLIAQGRWRGPGGVVAFCKALALDEVLGVTIHEAAHALPYAAPMGDVEPTEAMRYFQRMSIERQLNNPVATSPDMPNWYAIHCLRFIRRALHLHARAWEAGFEVGLPSIYFCGHEHDLSPPWKYMHALGNEPQRMRICSFAEIEAERMPRAFCKLFHEDFARWCDARAAGQIQEVNHVAAVA